MLQCDMYFDYLMSNEVHEHMYGLFIALLHNIVACGNYLLSEMTVKTDTTDLYL